MAIAHKIKEETTKGSDPTSTPVFALLCAGAIIFRKIRSVEHPLLPPLLLTTLSNSC